MNDVFGTDSRIVNILRFQKPEQYGGSKKIKDTQKRDKQAEIVFNILGWSLFLFVSVN